MYLPASDDEITGLTSYLDQQLEAIRAAAVGLTEEQARMCPCRSALSIGGLIKHVTYGMQGVIDRLADTVAVRRLDEAAFARYQASLVVAESETVSNLLDDFDERRPKYLQAVGGSDPSGPTTEPPAPWHGIADARPACLRYFLVHQIEELARHAGHADILREQIDGTPIPAIMLSEAGMAASDFFTPYVAAPGTIGGRPATGAVANAARSRQASGDELRP
jgi:hypothetical protein